MLLLFFVSPHLNTDHQLSHDPPGDPLLPAGSPGHWAFTGAGSRWSPSSLRHSSAHNNMSLLFPITQVLGHGAVVFPPPRNNVDHGEQPWAGQVSSHWWRAGHVTSVLTPHSHWSRCPPPCPLLATPGRGSGAPYPGPSSTRRSRVITVKNMKKCYNPPVQDTTARPASGSPTGARTAARPVTAPPAAPGSTTTR